SGITESDCPSRRSAAAAISAPKRSASSGPGRSAAFARSSARTMDHLENSSFLLDSNSQLEGDAPGAAQHGGTPTSDEPTSSRDIEECLKLLDEVWPPEGRPTAAIPRQLGRFAILGELGRGGFGVVFLAEDTLLGRRVAVKVPRVEILAGSESWRRFLREA